MNARHPLLIALLLLGAVALALPTALAGPADDPAAALEGGTPVPEGATTVEFPWIAKQSISCLSDAEERMVFIVSFADDAHAALGSATLDGKGGGTGEFKVTVLDLKSGHEGRDEHMASATWLDAGTFPNVGLKITKVERVKPTVWRLTGTWTMHGKSSSITALANVRYIPEMDHFGKDVVRVKVSFPVSLKAHGIDNPYVGSPAVAEEWKVDVVLLGLMKKS